jgi:gamma-glutamyltranspeptidase/glutathione hydrolase
LATHGIVAASQPLAAQAGLRMLLAGGNAADAAIAVAATLAVVEPMSTGIGGDAFALVRFAKEGRVRALNGSGRAPAAASIEDARRRRLSAIPSLSPLAVTVPGTVDAWYQLQTTYGELAWADVLAPAIGYARDGFPVSPVIARRWSELVAKLSRDEAAARTFLVGGTSPRAGYIFRNPDMAATLQAIADGGPAAFYTGPIAQAIADAVQAKDGWLDTADLRRHHSTWEEPISTDYKGVTVYEHPPNGQGLVALLALNLISQIGLEGKDWGSPEATHLMVEAMRLGFADGHRYIADPAMAQLPIAELLSPAYAAARARLIAPDRALEHPEPGIPPRAGTVYLSAVDGAGNAVSFINSLYNGFGTGIVAPGTGVALQNRGSLFTLEAGHPNALAPGKRPYHTIIPAMACRQGELWLSFGVMGGFMQPQGHVQVITNLLDFGMGYQQALDAPRWRVDEDDTLSTEAGFPAALRPALRRMGHRLTRATPALSDTFGGGQIIARQDGILWGASEPRKDGCAVGY